MNKSQRIHLNTGDTENYDNPKYFTVRLEQDVETLEFMSMTLRTKDAYQNFNADYGVLVGRVIANGGIGVPNAKISIFIPLSDEDAENPDIFKIYPYTTPRDKNTEGKRYNLLPRVSKIDPEDGQIKPKQAFGSFPIKEEIVTNETFLEVYKKYYKYTTTTNNAGDYMIFGVPIGTQTTHLSVDITDIGKYSMNPAAMVRNLGYPESQFTNSNTRIKPSSDLTDLPNIETQEISVDVRPFWGDADTFEIGITRQDFRVRATLENTFVMFGTAFTDSQEALRGYDWSDAEEIRDYYYVYPNNDVDEAYNNWYTIGMGSKRIGIITEKIYTYPAEISDADIDAGNVENDGSDMILLDPSEYSAFKRNGDFVFIVNCNRNKVLTDEAGNEVPTTYDNVNGVFTSFRGFVTLEITPQDLPMTGRGKLRRDKTQIEPYRIRLKFPQYAGEGLSFDYSDDSTAVAWRKQHTIFESGKYYSFSRFHGTTFNNIGVDSRNFPLQKKIDGSTGGFFRKYDDDQGEWVNYLTKDARHNVGVILTEDKDGTINSFADFPSNFNGTDPRFGVNWMNFAIYLPQLGSMVDIEGGSSNVRGVLTADYTATQWENNTTRNKFAVFDNNMEIAASQISTKWFARSDLHWTDIIEVPLEDIITIKEYNGKGFTSSELGGLSLTNYRSGVNGPPDAPDDCPYLGGRRNGKPSTSEPKDSEYYFYKGFDTANVFDYLYDLGLVT